MKFTVNRKEFIKVLELHVKYLKSIRRAAVPCMRIAVKNDFIEIKSQIFENFITNTIKMEADNEVFGEHDYNSEALINILKLIKDKSITIEDNLILNGNITIPAIIDSDNEWECLDVSKCNNSYTFDRVALLNALDMGLANASKDDSRYVLHRVYIHNDKYGINIVATSGKAIYVHSFSNVDNKAINKLIKSESVKLLIDVLKKDTSDSVMMLWETEGDNSKYDIIFKSESFALITSSYNASYPNYRQVFPKSLERSISFKFSEFYNNIKALNTALKNDDEALINIHVDICTMLISAYNTPELPRIDMEIVNPANWYGEGAICFDSELILKTLKPFSKRDIEVKFQWNDSQSPILITVGDKEQFLTMPMRPEY